MNIEEMVSITIDCTDEDPPPSVIGYAYHGWEEDFKHEREQHQQSMAMREFDPMLVVAEVCRRLLAGEINDDESQMLSLAISTRHDEDLRDDH